MRASVRRVLSGLKRQARFKAVTALDLFSRPRGAGRSTARSDTLVIRTNRLGDFVLWLDAAKEIGRIPGLPGRRVLLTTAPSHELRDELPQFDEIWPFDLARMRSELGYRRRLLGKVAARRFEVVLNTILSRDPLIDDAVVRASGASRRIGAFGDLANATSGEQRVTDRWYTELHPAPPPDLMELQRAKLYCASLRARYPSAVPQLRGRYAPPSSLSVRRYYVLGAGASWSGKTWPVERFREIARRLYEKTGLPGVACGGRDEAAVTAALCAGGTPPLYDFGGRTTVRELIGVIAHAEFVVTNDTSIVHIAAAARVPAVVIVGGGHFGRFLPYDVDGPATWAPKVVHAGMPCFGCDWRCRFAPVDQGPKPCITEVSVDDVWAAVEQVVHAAQAVPAK